MELSGYYKRKYPHVVFPEALEYDGEKTVTRILSELGLDPEEIGHVMVENSDRGLKKKKTSPEEIPQDGDTLWIIPPILGG